MTRRQKILDVVQSSKEKQAFDDFNRQAVAALREQMVQDRWDRTVQLHPELNDPAVLRDFGAWLEKMNRPRFVVAVPEAADLYFSETRQKKGAL